MVAVTDARAIIFEEETQFRSSVSEALLTKMGGQSNFINNRQFDTHKWDANGRYSLFTILTGFDGKFAFLFNVEVIGYSLAIATTGTSGGPNIFDIHFYTGGDTDAGTIFSTKPSVTTGAADGSQSIILLDPATDLQLPTGHTKGVFSKTTFLAGEALEAQIDSTAVGTRNATLSIMYRPIN